jgi:hypothetical protein
LTASDLLDEKDLRTRFNSSTMQLAGCHAVSAPFESDEFLQLILVLIFFFMKTG